MNLNEQLESLSDKYQSLRLFYVCSIINAYGPTALTHVGYSPDDSTHE